jgi:excisionase family DNA binding protein
MKKSKERIPVEIAATLLFVKPGTIYGYIDKGWLKASRVGKRWLVDRTSVERLQETGTR